MADVVANLTVFLFFAFFVAVYIACQVYEAKQYKKTAYFKVTKNPYSFVKYNKGAQGEYGLYLCLQQFEELGGKFLFNLYMPTQGGGTSEIDVLLICAKGLFVFESKNYSGWIFGDEWNKTWTQTFPKGRGRSHKEKFYNPVMQNAVHIKHLKNLVHENIPARSIIVFSNQCTLKNIRVNSDVKVVHLRKVTSTVTEIYQSSFDFLTNEEVVALYERLYPYTQVHNEEKSRHISGIRGS